MPLYEPSGKRTGIQGVYRATVQKIEPDGRLWVAAPRLAGTDSIGPLPSVVLPRPIAPGDRVLLQSVEGMAENLIVIAVLANH